MCIIVDRAAMIAPQSLILVLPNAEAVNLCALMGKAMVVPPIKSIVTNVAVLAQWVRHVEN